MATLVCFHAHPDDESIATGGTMALAARAGHRVVLVVATRGEHGEPVPGVLAEGERLWERRVVETRDAASILGVDRVEFLGYVDSGMMGEATNDAPGSFWQADVDEAAERLAEILRAVNADVLTIYDSHGGYGHPDHIQVHRVGRRAAERAGVTNVFQSTMNRDHIMRQMAENAELFETELEGEVEGESLEQIRERVARAEREEFGSPEALITHAVDVRGVIDLKRDAMAAHASQIGPDSFFFAMPEPVFASTFGTEWYIALDVRREPDAPFHTSILD